MITTLNKIRAHSPCADGWRKLLNHLGKTQADDEPMPISTVLDSNGISDALWCLRAVSGCDREMRLFAVWCARRVEHLMSNPRSQDALHVADQYARGQVMDAELQLAASEDAAFAAWTAEAAEAAAWETVKANAAGAATDAASAAADAKWKDAGEAASAFDAERAAQADELRRVCAEIEAGRDPYPEMEDGR